MKPKMVLLSFGLKALTQEQTDETRTVCMPKADLYLDCRAVKDFSVGDISHSGGEHDMNQSSVLNASLPSITSMHRIIEDSLQWIPNRRAGSKDPYANPFVIACFCAQGIHRSVATKHLLAARLIKAGYEVEVLGK